MKQGARIGIAVGVIILVTVVVLGVDLARRQSDASLPAGSIPLYVRGELATAFVPDDLESLELVSFVDEEEGKTQEGWLLRDILKLYLTDDVLREDTVVVVSSTSREKSVTLTWPEVNDTGNMVMFDLAGRGTLKLVSKLERLDIRDEWVQDVDRIEVE